MKIPAAAPLVCLSAGLIVLASGCKSLHSHANRPLRENSGWPDCRASSEITQPRGEEDVLVILCLSGGGSRAAWFSAATMLRLESIVDEINLLHEVDVISSVSGGGLPAAYYCVSRDPGPYSVVRVETLPEHLPPELAGTIKLDRQRGLLGVRGRMTDAQRDLLRELFASPHDQACVERLHWLSNRTRAPAVWQPEAVRDLMTHNYINELLRKSFSPLNIANDFRYWWTSYDRSDQMAEIFSEHLFGTKAVLIPKPLRETAELEFLGWLDRPHAGDGDSTTSQSDDDALRWPKEESIHAPLRLDWVPGFSPARQAAQWVAGDVVMGNVDQITRKYRRTLPYRFKDLNPARPYLILNATNGSEDDPDEAHYGSVFPFTREVFERQLNSSIDDYPLAWGVMASAAFPGVFSFVTLRDYRPTGPDVPPRYMHVFDGGNSDNLGLTSAKQIILANRDRYRHFVVLLVDSHVSKRGADRNQPDVRTKVLDLNFMSSFGTLLDSVRRHSVEEFTSGVLDGQNLADKLTFWQITLDDVRNAELRAKANQIPTNFKIKPESVDVLTKCVDDLVRHDHPKLQEFLRVLGVNPNSASEK